MPESNPLNCDLPSDKKGVKPQATHPEFDEFVHVIAELRAPDGCPWDKEQTNYSISRHIVEEAYECVGAIEEGDVEQLEEELGDLLEQVVLQSQIAADNGYFTIDDVSRGIKEKMIRRHPHVFGDKTSAETSSDVLDIWSEVKKKERKDKSDKKEEHASLLDDVPQSMPALLRAQKVSKRMVSAGFEWDDVDDVWAQVKEEIDEYNKAVPGSLEAEMEFGDILFTLVNVARKQGIDAETALRRSVDKVSNRWKYMERAANKKNTPVDALTIDEQEKLWDEAKSQEGIDAK